RKKSRVSSRFPPSENDFTNTVPGGNSKLPSASCVMRVPSGIDSQRSFVAPSDQKGATGAKGTNPAAGLVTSPGSVQPVCESSWGNPPVPPLLADGTVSPLVEQLLPGG